MASISSPGIQSYTDKINNIFEIVPSLKGGFSREIEIISESNPGVRSFLQTYLVENKTPPSGSCLEDRVLRYLKENTQKDQRGWKTVIQHAKGNLYLHVKVVTPEDQEWESRADNFTKHSPPEYGIPKKIYIFTFRSSPSENDPRNIRLVRHISDQNAAYGGHISAGDGWTGKELFQLWETNFLYRLFLPEISSLQDKSTFLLDIPSLWYFPLVNGKSYYEGLGYSFTGQEILLDSGKKLLITPEMRLQAYQHIDQAPAFNWLDKNKSFFMQQKLPDSLRKMRYEPSQLEAVLLIYSFLIHLEQPDLNFKEIKMGHIIRKMNSIFRKEAAPANSLYKTLLNSVSAQPEKSEEEAVEEIIAYITKCSHPSLLFNEDILREELIARIIELTKNAQYDLSFLLRIYFDNNSDLEMQIVRKCTVFHEYSLLLIRQALERLATLKLEKGTAFMRVQDEVPISRMITLSYMPRIHIQLDANPEIDLPFRLLTLAQFVSDVKCGGVGNCNEDLIHNVSNIDHMKGEDDLTISSDNILFTPIINLANYSEEKIISSSKAWDRVEVIDALRCKSLTSIALYAIATHSHQLKELKINNPALKDQAYIILAHKELLENLTRITIMGGTTLTSKTACAILEAHPDLEEINFSKSSNIDDTVIQKIMGMKKIQVVYLNHCQKVSSEAVGHLIQSRPDLLIISSKDPSLNQNEDTLLYDDGGMTIK